MNEKPLLLNPEIDNPEEYLEFFYDGFVKEISGKERGRETINICNLNRDSLRYAQRKTQIDEILRDIKEQSHQLLDKYGSPVKVDKTDYGLAYENIFKKIKERRSPEYEFSRVYFYFYENFDEFLEKSSETRRLSGSWKRIIKDAFATFKQGVLQL